MAKFELELSRDEYEILENTLKVAIENLDPSSRVDVLKRITSDLKAREQELLKIDVDYEFYSAMYDAAVEYGEFDRFGATLSLDLGEGGKFIIEQALDDVSINADISIVSLYYQCEKTARGRDFSELGYRDHLHPKTKEQLLRAVKKLDKEKSPQNQSSKGLSLSNR